MTFTILFVCTGNVGRSPLAEVMARRLLAEELGVGDDELEANGIRVFSAGTRAPSGVQASARAGTIAEEIGISLGRHPSERLTRQMVARADVIYCMDSTQIDDIAQLEVADKVSLLDPDGSEILDPRGRDLDFYREVRDQMASALRRRVPEILAHAGKA